MKLGKVKKIIVVTASYDPLRKGILRLVENIAKEKNLEVEVKEEDWVFLMRYGEKDELGGASIPQVFLEYEDGTIKHVLTRLPLDERGRTDKERARQIILEAIEKGIE